MKKHSKLLVLLLSIALVILAVAIVAGAAEGSSTGNVAKIGDTEYATLQEACAAAKGGQTITLIADATVSEMIPLAGGYTIDLNGYAINATVDKAFKTATPVTTTITGEGTINADGILIFSDAASSVQTLNIIGTGKGITINHTGKANSLFHQTTRGNYTYKNVELNLTVVKTTSDIQAINLTTDAALTFDTSVININNTTVRHTERFIYMTKATTFRLKNSVLNMSCVFGWLDNLTAEEPIVIENSAIYAIPNEKMTTEASVKQEFFRGKTDVTPFAITIRNSYMEYAYRLIINDVAITVNFESSTLRHIGLPYNLAEYNNEITRGGTANFDAKSVYLASDKLFITHGASGGGEVNVKEGFRTNAYAMFMKGDSNVHIEGEANIANTTSAYKFVFDPAGNSAAPYVLVKIVRDAEGNDITPNPVGIDGTLDLLGNLSNMVPTSIGNKIFTLGKDSSDNTIYTFDEQNVTVNNFENVYLSDEGVKASVSNGTCYFSNYNLGQAGSGTLLTTNFDGNIALKYWVNPTDEVKGAPPAGDRCISYNFGTPILNSEGVQTGTKQDCPCFFFTKDIEATAGSVVTYSVDFATDSDAYVKTLFRISNKGGDGTNHNNGNTRSIFTLERNGKITPQSNLKKDSSVTDAYVNPAEITLAPGSGWHRFSVVIYSDAKVAHIYLDNQYIGSTQYYNNAVPTKVEGFRIDVSDAYQQIDSTLLFDNFMANNFTYSADNAATPSVYNVDVAKNTQYGHFYQVGGKTYSDINAALNDAAALGTVVQLIADVRAPQLVTANGYVYTNGYEFNIADGSHGADLVLDGDETVGYEFNEAYNELKVTYAWFPGYGEMYSDTPEKYYTFVEVGVGQTPSVPESLELGYPCQMNADGKYEVASLRGWATTGTEPEEFVPITVSKAKEMAGSIVYVYPVFTTEMTVKDTNWNVVDYESGAYKRGGKNPELWGSTAWNSFKLQNGDTFVLTGDLTMFGGFSYANFADNGKDKLHGIDVNGYTLTLSPLTAGYRKASVWDIKFGETLDVYSSRPGGVIFAEGINDQSGITKGASGGCMFQFQPAGLDFASNNGETNMDTHLNIGKPEYKNYLTLSAAAIVGANSGDKTCSITIDGVTLVRNSGDFFGAVYTRFYNGTFDIKNSTIISAVDNNIINAVGAALEVKDGEIVNKVDPTVTVDNCTIIVKNNGGTINGNSHVMGSLKFTNVVTNGSIRINSRIRENLYVGENVSAHAIDAIVEDGIVLAKYNVPITIEGDTVTVKYISIPASTTGKTDAKEFQRLYYTFASNGYAGEADTVLGKYEYKTVKAEDVVNVTFEGLGGNDPVVVPYAKGGNVSAYGVKIADAVVGAFKLVADGGLEYHPANIQEDVTVTPTYEVRANLEGLKVNLSLYSDFDINLYIPATYKDSIESITNGAEVIKQSDVIIDDVNYIKVVIRVAAANASKNATFTINLKNGDYAASASVTVSIATYADYILADTECATFTKEDRELMYAMIDYANEAYKYFNAGATDETLEALLKKYDDAKATLEAPVYNTIENTNVAKVFEEATISLESSPVFVFRVKSGFVGKVTISYGEHNSYEFDVKADTTEIKLDKMKIYNFGLDIKITAEGNYTDAEGNVEAVTVTDGAYNLDTFVSYHVNNDSDESKACVALLNVLYNYVEIAAAYVA